MQNTNCILCICGHSPRAHWNDRLTWLMTGNFSYRFDICASRPWAAGRHAPSYGVDQDYPGFLAQIGIGFI